ncbi:putative LRR receptor-like serine/threonine-protein kinase [Dichanthelium oligosanthes]|uniref:non-specific serine/threonine protein kinase n=1 Tax=Dichanthelium oligosanthes TaxID=888268 RepID=A0A1E5VQ41_9POAL|nr:putative LRR receptor-like serine/threonine-protein kinase [Dichanthelium oligosanthes]
MSSVVSLLFCLLILLSISITVRTAAEANKTEIDRQALLCFKSGISSDPLGILNSWLNTSLNFCSWPGVTCGARHPNRVVSLDLTSMHLGGQIHGCIANMTSLLQINLTDNQLSGAIPDELSKLAGLQTLMLANNHLEGNLPGSLGTSMSLSYVNLANNSLTGGIPHSLACSSSLSTLILSRNNLIGKIPATLFANSSTLATVDLQMNSLTGIIPPFGMVTALKYLCVVENFLSGSIPPSIGNVSSLRFILLGQNILTGPIPESLGDISKLLELDLSFNSLTGHVPLSLYNMPSLKHFSLGSNGLVGQVPSNIGYSLPNLQVLILESNNLKGLIPASLENASNLQVLDLSNNSLHGRIPSLGSLPRLRQVLLGRNQLEAYDWQFLASLTNCAQLTKLSLEGNMLNGSLPGSVGNLSTSLENLLLGSNQISGSIPVEISNLVNLTMLSMENNLVSGGIPATMGKLRNLFILNLSKNKLSGHIPSSIGSIAQLGKFYLDDNNLSGNIPSSLGRCLGLLQLNLSSNRLDGSLPEELFRGPFLSLGVDFSHNNLTGEILMDIGRISALSSLNLGGNKLHGQIPANFRFLISIQYINLSRNDLSGTLPGFFENLTMLEKLDLSYNNFEGPIPTGGCFQNSTAVFLDGNMGLCSWSSTPALPFCDGTSEVKNHVSLLLIVIPLLIMALLLLLWLVVTRKKRVFEFLLWNDILKTFHFIVHPKRREVQTFPHNYDTLKKVSYGDIQKATNCFSSIHTISSTHTGSVYVGRFKFDNDLVAIKVFNLNERGVHESYFTECEVLRSIRHRNILKIVTLCSTLDTENNEFKALVFQFMANGSLERLLHPQQTDRPKRTLTIGQRICIVTDVASALDYLHNQLIPPLVHCDLKPSNVLLDYDMTARVGDFGSARFLSPDSGGLKHLVSVQGTIGYLAPEYGMGCGISTGGDVYSFGVLLLETLTGKRPTDDMFVDGLNLHSFTDSMFPDRVAEILDPHMSHEEHQLCAEVWMQSYIIPLVALSLSCSMESPKDRPGMQDVCAELCAIKEAFLES